MTHVSSAQPQASSKLEQQAIWQRVLSGDVDAYRVVVESHQAAVSAVAYSILGDFSAAQDVAQDTFLAAWTQRNQLRDTSRMSYWLCGIARNLARQTRKRLRRMKTNLPAETLSDVRQAESFRQDDSPWSREDRELVWSALAQMPDKYREVVTLYYRQGQSIEEVSAATGLSETTARQRLSRGRNLLRGRVAQIIDGVLRGTVPDGQFAARVIAAIVGVGAAAKTAGAASAAGMPFKTVAAGTSMMAAAKGAGAAGATAGLMGGALGTGGGLLGGWLGTWIPAQMAPTETERQLLLERGRTLFRWSLVFTAMVVALTAGLVFFQLAVFWFCMAIIGSAVVFNVCLVVHCRQTNVLIQELRRNVTPESDPNLSRLGNWARSKSSASKSGQAGYLASGKSYTSPTTFLGIPLLDVQLSSPGYYGNGAADHKRKTARGWIAIGDIAVGYVFAFGGIARGLIALGGITFGAVALGGLSVGLVSLGGCALGGLALGGVAIGWVAGGGLAIGGLSAAGGLAIAWHVAAGGVAYAFDFAVGGHAVASEVNTELAKAVVQRYSVFGWIEWVSKHQLLFQAGVAVVVMVPIALFVWLVRRLPDDNPAAGAPRLNADQQDQ